MRPEVQLRPPKAADPHRLQRNLEVALRAEMKVPWVAELRFRVEPLDAPGAALAYDAAEQAERSRLWLIARSRPMGLAGLAYWYAMLPFTHSSSRER